MGLFSGFKRVFGRKVKSSILLLGLDNSGKTSIVNFMKKGSGDGETVPTIGFSEEEFKKDNVRFIAFDMSGQGRYRCLWDKYYSSTNAIIFVIDSADKVRLCVVRDELELMLNSPELNRVPILIFANKMDVANAMTPIEISQALGLDGLLTDWPWSIHPSNALTGEGIDRGFDWLVKAFIEK